jgi:UDP-glucose 4-epimerase
MRIAVLGGAGFIGSKITKAYVQAGHDVCVIDNLAGAAEPPIDTRVRFYKVDLREEKIHSILQKERPDVVSHHAVQPQEAVRGEHILADADVHIRGLLNVLEGCIRASVKKIIFASGGVDLYAGASTPLQIVNEETPLHPAQAQDVSKAAGEWYIRLYTQQHRLQHTILRYADVYGETDPHHLHHPLGYFAGELLAQRQPLIYGNGEDARDHIFVDDIVQANLLALTRGENMTLHISSGQGYTMRQLYQTVARALGNDIQPLYLLEARSTRSTIILDHTRAKHDLGWQPQWGFAQGVCRAVAQLRARYEQEQQENTNAEERTQAALTHV